MRRLERGIGLAATALLLLGGSSVGAAAQGSGVVPELPASLTHLPGGGVVLHLDVPEGWALYTEDPGPLGLPLTISWSRDGEPLEPEVRWPEGARYETPTGAARVWRSPVRGVVSSGDPALELKAGESGPLEAEVRWALCRADLCVPGRTRVELGLP